MADETIQTETQPDTTTSPIDGSVAVETPTQPSPPAEAPPAADTDATALGGDPQPGESDEAPEQPQGAPEKYELAMEGLDLDTATVADAEPILRELNLTNDAANKLLPVAASLVERTSERLMQTIADQGAAVRKGWLDEAKAADDIGGAKWDETLHVAAKGLDALGFRNTGHGEDGKQPHPFRKVLNETGFGNHPDMIRMAKAIGGMVGEDGNFARSNESSPDKKDVADRWYSNAEKGS